MNYLIIFTYLFTAVASYPYTKLTKNVSIYLKSNEFSKKFVFSLELRAALLQSLCRAFTVDKPIKAKYVFSMEKKIVAKYI